MKKAYLEALQGRRADIKRKWEVLLRAAPMTTPLGHPDALVHLMDESLGQLFSLYHSHATRRWLSRHPPAANRIGHDCHCRLNPLINYFIAGQTALTFVAQAVPSADHRLNEVKAAACLDELILTFHFLAHREINAFCEVCQYSPANGRAARGTALAKPVCPLPWHMPSGRH